MEAALLTLFAETSAAVISECGSYRYSLMRSWDDSLPRLCWVMLNPSTADAAVNDATIRTCIAFAKIWGFGSIVVVNLFAYRSTDPRKLLEVADAIGPENDRYIHEAVSTAARVVVAWGARGALMGRGAAVARSIGECYRLKITKHGEPGHPLYTPLSCELVRFQPKRREQTP